VYALLKAGDAAFLDMHTLHSGLANLPEEEGGSPRILMVVAFRNPKAKHKLSHKSNMRPSFVGKFTLGDVRAEELASEEPFSPSRKRTEGSRLLVNTTFSSFVVVS
jgi:hypothetical protein